MQAEKIIRKEEIRNRDVLLGKIGYTGNVLFRQHVRSRKFEYRNAAHMIIREPIIEEIFQWVTITNSGRFLRPINKEKTLWREVSKKEAIVKIKRVLQGKMQTAAPLALPQPTVNNTAAPPPAVNSTSYRNIALSMSSRILQLQQNHADSTKSAVLHQLEDVVQKCKQFQNELSMTRVERDMLKQKLQALELENLVAKQKTNELQNELSLTRFERDKLKQKLQALELENHAAKQKTNELQNKLVATTTELEALKKYLGETERIEQPEDEIWV